MARARTRIDLQRRPVRKGRIRYSKRVLRRIKAAGELRGAIEFYKAEAAAGFRRRFAPDLRDGEVVPDQALALELAGRSVTWAIEQLTEADNDYCGQGVRRKQLNNACIGAAREEVYPELVDVRRSIDARFGRGEGRQVHEMEGRTRRKPARLYPQLERLVRNLKNPRHELPAPRRPGVKVDRRGWLRQLEPGYLKLTAMLEQLEQEEKRENQLRDERDYELDSFDAVYSEALAFVRSVFSLAGISEREIWHLLPNVQRRRLRGKAKQERGARAEGLRQSKGQAAAGDSRPAGPVNVA